MKLGRLRMNRLIRFILVLCGIVAVGCQNSTKPWTSANLGLSPATQPDSTVLHFDQKGSFFTYPGAKYTFCLHLGDELYHDTGGITEIPRNIKEGAIRAATSSYWEPVNGAGDGYAAAESVYTRGYATPDLIARNTLIQYESDSRRLLITEDVSDASACRRYILYTEYPGGGFSVKYLGPTPIRISGSKTEFSSLTPDIRLLPGDRAEINGKIMRIDEIPQSTHPFAMGD